MSELEPYVQRDAARRSLTAGTTVALSAPPRSPARLALLVGDAVLTTALPFSPQGSSQAVRSGTRRYRRVQRAVRLLARLAPAAFDALRDSLWNPVWLPFRFASAKVLSFGSGSTVYLLYGTSGSTPGFVIKVFRKSYGMATDQLADFVGHRAASYRRVAEWYHDCNVVPPTQFLLLQSPLCGKPVAACVQPFFPGLHEDVFADLSEQRLLQLLNGSQHLRLQFRRFVERAADTSANEAACVDLVGRGNLVLVDHDGCPEFKLLDLGVYEFARKSVRAPSRLKELKERIAYLEQLSEQVR